LRMILARGELIRFGDERDALDAGQVLELIDQCNLLGIDDAEDRDHFPLDTGVDERREPFLLHDLDDAIHLLGRGALLHDDDHPPPLLRLPTASVFPRRRFQDTIIGEGVSRLHGLSSRPASSPGVTRTPSMNGPNSAYFALTSSKRIS